MTNCLRTVDKPASCMGESGMATGEPDIHDTTDDDYWRGLTVDELMAAVAEQIEPDSHGGPVDDDYVHAVMVDAARTVSEDVMDRAVDMAGCNKVDECRAQAVFLTWLAWNLDQKLLP